MTQPSRQQRRREEFQREKQARRKAARALRERQAAQGLLPAPRATLGNGKSTWKTVAEEKQARQQTVEEQLRVYRSLLPALLQRWGKIPDPRNPLLIRHKLTVLLLYGMVMFAYQLASRREANRTLSLPQYWENLQLLFPELESLPHGDTLARLLARMEVNQIQESLIALVQQLIRKKKFSRYLIAGHYPIAVDGTQKLKRDWLCSEACLERQVQTKQEDGTAGTRTQYYVSVLEAQLALANGMTIPLFSEFLDYRAGDQEKNKQDCEQKAFYRLAERLKEYFPRLPILLLLDGLYADGPIVELCRRYHWQFMIVLQDQDLPSVWEEFRGLGQLERQNRLERNWGNRQQRFRWVNGIEYRYGEQERKKQILHVVLCEESWEELAVDSPEVVQKTARHAWISSAPLSRDNVHERCNLGARHRWGIGVSREGYIDQSVRVRPRLEDSSLVAWEASWSKSDTTEPSDNMLRKEYAQRTRLQRAVNAEVASLHVNPVAETVDNVRKQQGLTERSPKRQPSPAGYQRRHGVKVDVSTGEALDARRRNLAEEALAITLSGKCRRRHQGDGSGRSTEDERAVKHARREGPGPVSTPFVKVRQG